MLPSKTNSIFILIYTFGVYFFMPTSAFLLKLFMRMYWCRERTYNVAMADTLLFQAQVVFREVDKEVMFFKGEVRELPDGAGGAFDGVVGDGGGRFPVRLHRAD